MGKVKFGLFVVDGRGKVGGTVMSKNKGGAYFKNKVSPSQPRTASQSTARQRLTTYAQGFRALTTTQIAAWNSAVPDFLKTDVFGDLKTPTGQNLYVKLNTNLAQIAGTALTTPPVPNSPVGPVTLTITAAAGTPAVSAAFTVSPVPAATTWLVEATRQMSPGRSSAGAQFRIITTIAAAATSPANLLATYNTKFGTLVAGQKIFFRIRAVSTVSGIKSQPLVASVIVAA